MTLTYSVGEKSVLVLGLFFFFPFHKRVKYKTKRASISGGEKAPSFGVFLLPLNKGLDFKLRHLLSCIPMPRRNCQPQSGGTRVAGGMATPAHSLVQTRRWGGSRHVCSMEGRPRPITHPVSNHPTMTGPPLTLPSRYAEQGSLGSTMGLLPLRKVDQWHHLPET